MKRRIQFRGKSIDKNEWIFGGLHISGEKCYIMNKFNDRLFQMIEVKPETVGQFIGRKDSEGVDIYDDDIISMDVYVSKEGESIENNDETTFLVPPKEDYILGWVAYNEKESGFFFCTESDDGVMYTEIDEDATVMGNLHDHKYLLDNK